MKFGIRLYGADPEVVVDKARVAEALGYESVWRGDHLLVPAVVTTPYPYTSDGANPFRTDSPVLDVLVLYGFMAQATTHIKLATGVYILPLRDPVAVARAVQTLDILSKGRVIFGVGAGWMREEFDVVGRSFDARGRVLDEALHLIRTLWTHERPTFEGEHFRFGEVRFEPKPVQQPHPPVVVGGESPAALRRAAAHDGWYGHVSTPDQAREAVGRLRALRRDAGREGAPFEVTVRIPADVSRSEVERFAEAGVDRLVLQVGAFDDPDGRGEIAVWEKFAERVMA